MHRTRLFIALIVALSTITVISEISASQQYRTYEIWDLSTKGEIIDDILFMPNSKVGNLVVLSHLDTQGFLTFIDSGTGHIVKEVFLDSQPTEAFYLDHGFLAISRIGAIEVYRNGDRLYTINASRTDIAPSYLGTFTGADLVFLDGFHVRSYNISAGKETWSLEYAYPLSSFIILSYNQSVLAHFNHVTEKWILALINQNGTEIASIAIEDPERYDYIRLSPFSESSFLYSKTNDTMAIMRRLRITNDTFLVDWEIEIDRDPLNIGFLVHDLNNDGYQEILVALEGKVCLLDGSNGRLYFMPFLRENRKR